MVEDMTKEEIVEKIQGMLEEGEEVEAICKLPEKIRKSMAAVGEIMKIFPDYGEEDQKLLLDNFPLLKQQVLPKSCDMIMARMNDWYRDNEADVGTGEQRTKDLIKMFNDLYDSAICRWVKEIECYDKKVDFLFTLGNLMQYATSDKAPKFLKKSAILATWCQRLTNQYFEVPPEEIKGKPPTEKDGTIIDRWIAARKTRSNRLWKVALDLLIKDEGRKTELKRSLINAFDPDYTKVDSKTNYSGDPGTLRLVFGENNVFFAQFSAFVKKYMSSKSEFCVEDKKMKGYYEEHLVDLPKNSVDLPKFLSVFLKTIDKNEETFKLEDNILKIQQSGIEELKRRRIQATPNRQFVVPQNNSGGKGMMGNNNGGGGKGYPPQVYQFLERKGMSAEQLHGKDRKMQQTIVDAVLRQMGMGSPNMNGGMGNGNNMNSGMGNNMNGGMGNNMNGGMGNNMGKGPIPECQNPEFRAQIRKLVGELKGKGKVDKMQQLADSLIKKGTSLQEIMSEEVNMSNMGGNMPNTMGGNMNMNNNMGGSMNNMVGGVNVTNNMGGNMGGNMNNNMGGNMQNSMGGNMNMNTNMGGNMQNNMGNGMGNGMGKGPIQNQGMLIQPPANSGMLIQPPPGGDGGKKGAVIAKLKAKGKSDSQIQEVLQVAAAKGAL